MVAPQPILCKCSALPRHVAPIIHPHYLVVWVKSSIRRCYHQRTNDVRYASLPYSTFRFSLILHFCNFPDWFEPWLWTRPFLSRALAKIPAARNLRTPKTAKSLSCRHGFPPTEGTINGSFWKSLLDRVVLKTIA